MDSIMVGEQISFKSEKEFVEWICKNLQRILLKKLPISSKELETIIPDLFQEICSVIMVNHGESKIFHEAIGDYNNHEKREKALELFRSKIWNVWSDHNQKYCKRKSEKEIKKEKGQKEEYLRRCEENRKWNLHLEEILVRIEKITKKEGISAKEVWKIIDPYLSEKEKEIISVKLQYKNIKDVEIDRLLGRKEGDTNKAINRLKQKIKSIFLKGDY